MSYRGLWLYKKTTVFMQTKFDSMVTKIRLYAVSKAIIPYIDNNLTQLFSRVYIKFIELENTFRINQNVSIAAMNDNHKEGLKVCLRY